MMTIFSLAALLLFVLFGCRWALSANTDIPRVVSPDIDDFDVDAAVHIYKNAFIGRNIATGYVSPMIIGDEFVAIAYEEADNSSGAAGAMTCRGYDAGRFKLYLSGVTRDDIGKAVFATADNTIALTGHALAFIGRIVGIEATSYPIVELKKPGELPRHDEAPYSLGGPWTVATGATAGSGSDGDGCLVESTLGLGTIPANDGRLQLSLDNTSEISNASVKTPKVFDVDNGIVFKCKLAAYSVSGTAMTGTVLDLDFGLADAVVVTAVDPTYHVRFHVDAGATSLLLGADDNTHDVAETDTTLEIPLTAALAEEYVIIIRTDGTVEVYVEGDLLSTPDLSAVDFTGLGDLMAFINIEKTADAGIAIIEVLDFKVFGGK